MATVGYHASHKQLAPSALLRAVRAAEDAGFEAAMCSDHLAPWTRAQGHSGHSWVSHDGLGRVDRARLWSLSDTPPALVGAPVSAHTAGVVGGWADGLITINQPTDVLRRVFHAFREGGGESKPVYLQVHLCWDPDEGAALATAHDQWRSGVFDPSLMWNLETPEQFDAAARFVEPDDVRSAVLVSADLGRHRAWLEEFVDLGVDGLHLHHVGRAQDAFLDAFASSVLPELKAGR
ncbi:MAG: LLM class flavin-dependent oxidoreductase [Acidimicrobiales bacterium]